MADPASLLLGLVPIVGGVVKSYKAVYRKLNAFAHASWEVNRIRRLLRQQHREFMHEIHLVLRCVLQDESEVEAMVNDGDHERWKSPTLDAGLRRFFGLDYDSFEDIVCEAGVNVEYLLQELEACDRLLEKEEGTIPGKRERLINSVHQARGAVKVALDQTKCQSAIQSLRMTNDDMRRLRKRTSGLKQPKEPGTISACLHDSDPILRTGYSSCPKIRRAAKALHHGLSTSFLRQSHEVRLFVQPKLTGDQIVTDLAVQCAGGRTRIRNVIRVHSCPILSLPTPVTTPESSMERLHVSEESFKRRKVQRQDRQNRQGQAETHERSESSRRGQWRQNSSQPAQDLCLELCQKTKSHGKGIKDDSLCYVDTSVIDPFRHSFYLEVDNYPSSTKVTTLDKILDLPVETAITMVEQLKLARTIVVAVLYFSCTPWLAEHWGLHDLGFFPDEQGDLSTKLRTVNLGVTISEEQAALAPTAVNGATLTPPDSQFPRSPMEQAMLQHGIRNLALHNLGAALLQIGRWKPVDPNDLLDVRGLAESTPRLGRRYRDLVQKCLYCNFRGGKDLARPQLQQEVWEGVVEELDELIQCLDLSVDDEPS